MSAAMLNEAPPSTLPPQRVGDRSDGRLGAGEFVYRDDPAWAKLPDGWSFRNVAAVGVDSKDNVYVFDRGPHPIMVFDRTAPSSARGARASSSGRMRSMSARTTPSGSPTTATTSSAATRRKARCCSRSARRAMPPPI